MEKELDEYLTEKKIVGFIPQNTGTNSDTGEPLYSWILKSRLLEETEKKE